MIYYLCLLAFVETVKFFDTINQDSMNSRVKVVHRHVIVNVIRETNI
mgnify:CR=1 FL=1